MHNPSGRTHGSFAEYRRLLGYVRPYKRQFIAALLAMGVYGATDGAVPYILKRVLDDVFGNKNEQMLDELIAVIMVFAVIRGLFGFLERYLIGRVGHSVVRDIRNDIHSHLLRLSPEFFAGRRSGELVSTVTNDTLLVRAAAIEAAGSVLRDCVRILALFVVAVYLDPVLATIAFLGFPLGLYPVLRFGKKVRRLSRQGQDSFGGLTALLHEGITGHRVVQGFVQEQNEHARFASENEALTRTMVRAEKYGALSGPTNEILASLAIAAVILYGGYSVLSGVRTQGDFIAFITAMFLLYEPLKKLGRVNTTIQAGIAGAERIFEILDTPPTIADRPGAEDLTSRAPHIEYRNVTFRYPSHGAPHAGEAGVIGEGAPDGLALVDVSLTIQPGTTVALVGMSGGGKSTLVNLLPRFYDPSEGSILIDGKELAGYTVESLRRSIAVVGQHPFLFHHTVRFNIAYGRPDATHEEIVAAASAANADQFIRRLPQGYDTMIGEQGFRLSGGERARLAIARALMSDAPILILDEATASLDSESERAVQDAIDRLMENRTVLVIAHRLSTVRKADQIAVLSRGRIVERGTHTELLQKGGEYSKLYRLQFKDEAGTSQSAGPRLATG